MAVGNIENRQKHLLQDQKYGSCVWDKVTTGLLRTGAQGMSGHKLHYESYTWPRLLPAATSSRWSWRTHGLPSATASSSSSVSCTTQLQYSIPANATLPTSTTMGYSQYQGWGHTYRFSCCHYQHPSQTQWHLYMQLKVLPLDLCQCWHRCSRLLQ